MACLIGLALSIGLVLLASPSGATNVTNTTNVTATKMTMLQQLENTVRMFEVQPKISQELSKDFFAGVIGHNMGTTGVGASKWHTETSIDLFDGFLNQLINGDPANDILSAANMSLFVQTAVTALSGIWAPLKGIIEHNSNGSVSESLLLQIAIDCKTLLSATENVMVQLVTMAMSAGATAEAVVVTTARRQTMLMYKISKELLLIGLGVEVSQYLADLQETATVQVGGANRGLIKGAPWANIPRVTKLCTLAQMRTVSNKLAVVKPFIDDVISGGIDNAQAVANEHAYNAVAAADDLEHDMEAAVSLYKHDDGSCDVLSSMTTVDWSYLVNLVAIQRFFSVRLGLQVMQIANNVAIESSKVDITIKMSTVSASLRVLIEGNAEYSSPPTQQIVDQLITAYTVWQEYSGELSAVIFVDAVDSVIVGKIIRLSGRFLYLMNVVMTSYRALVKVHDTGVPGYIIHIAGRQRMFFQRLALRANEVKFYLDHNKETSAALKDLNKSRDVWLSSHWSLLEGDPAHNMSETTDLCIIMKMKEVKDAFDMLKVEAFRVAAGEKPTTEMIDLTTIAHNFMHKATAYYSDGVQGTCPDVVEQTLEGWEARVIAAGRARTSSQKTGTQWLWDFSKVPGPNAGDVSATFVEAHGTIGEGMVNAVRKLRFGCGSDNLPAPYDDKMNEDLAGLRAAATKFSQDLLLDSPEAIASDSALMLQEAEKLVADYILQSLAAFPAITARRIDLSTQLEFLANKMLKQALLMRHYGSRRLQTTYATAIGQADLTHTANEYMNIVRLLKDGAASLGVPAVTEQRQDIEHQQALVASAFAVFHQNIQCVSNSGCKATSTTKQSLDDLEKEIAGATLLYMVQDPPAPAEGFPYTMLIYLVIAVLIVVVIGFACYRGLRQGQKEKPSAGP